MLLSIYARLGVFLRRQIFKVNDGNEDWRDLVHPEIYGLTQTQNFYMKVKEVRLPVNLSPDSYRYTCKVIRTPLEALIYV